MSDLEPNSYFINCIKEEKMKEKGEFTTWVKFSRLPQIDSLLKINNVESIEIMLHE